MKRRNRSTILINTIRQGVHQLVINNHVYAYLVEGKEKALLIDTGWGTVDLKAAVESITSLPLMVVNTHGHLDHVFGNYQFKEAYLRDEDLQLLNDNLKPETRKEIIEKFGSDGLPNTISSEAWIKLGAGKTLSLNQVLTFDLGGTVLEVIHTPGHTKGSVVLLDKDKRILYSGDTVLEGFVLLHFNSSGGLKVYHNSILKLLDLSGNFDDILPSHSRTPLDLAFLRKVEEALSSIITGKKAGAKGELFDTSCLICDFENFSIVYPGNALD